MATSSHITNGIHLGTRTGHFVRDVPVVLSPRDRMQHLAILGRSGVGKSTLLKTLFAHDVVSDAGCAIIDPHGDLAKECLALVPRRRSNELLYLNPSDLEFPVAFNLLENVAPDLRPALVARLVGMFRNLFGSSWGYRVERLLLNALSVLLDLGDATLIGLVRLLDDEAWRERALRHTVDPLVRRYWAQEFPRLDDRLGGELDQPLHNKLSFLAAPALRNIVGQPRSTFHPRRFMDQGNVLIADLSKGLLGDIHAQLLGSLIVAGFEQAAMTRSDIPEAERRPFHLAIDEFQNFTTDSFPIILAEARKYGLSLTTACQYLAQLTDSTRSALLGNVGSMVAFRLGVEDAAIIAQEMQIGDPSELTTLEVGTAWARMLEQGYATSPALVRMTRLAASSSSTGAHGIAETVIRQSRRHYSNARDMVEKDIARFLHIDAPPTRRPSRRLRW